MELEARTNVLGPLYGGSFSTDAPMLLPYVLPGEIINRSSGEILTPSAHRVPPECAHFGTCGGCHYQHADYAAQLEMKQTILAQLLADAGLTEPPATEVAAGEPYQYRNRIRVRIEADAQGVLRYGYNLRASNAFLPILMCSIAAPLLTRAAGAISELASADALVRRWLMLTAELELFCTPDESKLQLQFFLRSADGGRRETSSFTRLCERLQGAVPELVGAGASLDPDLNRRARRLWQGPAWGADGLNYPVMNLEDPTSQRKYWLPRGAFFQVNRFLVERLVHLVTAGQSGELAWDLFAGVGLFTRALAERFTQVVAVEGSAAAMSSLEACARSHAGISPVHDTTLRFLQSREHQRDRPSLVVLDPPRAGLGVEGAVILARLKPRHIVYVSCDPTTLARDLAVLCADYRLTAMHLIDLFPQTFHIETIVHLELHSAGKGH